MNCRKCKSVTKDKDGKKIVVPGGRVFVDRAYSEKGHVELACIICGKRWMINKEKGVFGRWLVQTEVARALSAGITPSES